MHALKVSKLNKYIKGRQILSDISFTIEHGETLGLIGSNGAGKTSIIKCITGIWHNDSGNINICGYDLNKNFINCMRNVAAIIEYPKLFGNLTLMENIKFFSSFYDDIDINNLKKLLELLDLGEHKDKKIKTFSSGMQQKSCLLVALMKKPKILLLDEPTSMLDPKSSAEIRNFLFALKKKEQVSILISSHNLTEVEKLCDKVLVIDNGKTLSNLLINGNEKIRNYVIEVDSEETAREIYKIASHHYLLKTEGNKIYLTVKAEELRSFLITYCNKLCDLYADEKLEKDFLSLMRK